MNKFNNVTSRKEIQNNLIQSGIKSGDILFVKASLRNMGKINSRNRDDYLSAFLDVLGPEGTLIAPSYTDCSFLFRDPNKIFNLSLKSDSGALSNLMLTHPDAYRSSHPTNSCVAIGKYSKDILLSHTPKSGAYDPFKSIIEMNGKIALIGCGTNNPGFPTVHYAEVELGYHKKLIFPSLNTIYYKDNNSTTLFKRKDLGSCSSTFGRFYEFYINNELLTQTQIGNAYSLIISAADAYAIDKTILKKYPRITICDSKNCSHCNARRWDNLHKLPAFIVHRLLKKLF